MTSRTRNLVYLGCVLVALGYLGWSLIGRRTVQLTPPSASSVTPASPGMGSEVSDRAVPPAAGGADGDSAAGTEEGYVSPAGRRSYALSTAELSGLPPDAAAGTELEVWVAWDPPVTKRPKVQLLLKNVLLEKVIPGVTPEAPSVVLISVRTDQVPDLLWGDRYGALSVAVVQ